MTCNTTLLHWGYAQNALNIGNIFRELKFNLAPFVNILQQFNALNVVNIIASRINYVNKMKIKQMKQMKQMQD